MKLTREIEDDTITYFSGQKKIFWIKEILNENSVDVLIGGELLSETIHEFQDEMMALVSVGMDINIDLSDVTYIAVSYMQALLKIQVSIDKNEKGNMKLKNLPLSIQHDFDQTGITELLWIECGVIMLCKEKPYDGDKPYIFFSYCRADAERVYPIIEDLIHSGYRIWYDEGIHPGADWPEIIAKKLNDSAVCIAAISPKSTQSHNCRNEMTFTIQNDKYLISLQLDEFVLPLGIRLQLASTQMIRAYEYSKNSLLSKICSCEVLNVCLKDENDMIEESEQKAEEARIRAEKEAGQKAEEARIRAEKEARQKAEEEARIRAEKEAGQKAEEARIRAEEEAKQKAEEEARIRTEEEAKQKAEEEARIRAEEEAKQKAEEEARIRAEKEAKQKAEEEARIKAEKMSNTEEDETILQQEDDEVTVFCSDDSDEDSGNTIIEEAENVPIFIRLNTNEMFFGRYPLTSIGRSRSECDIYFETIKTMSSHHADIVIHDGHYFIIDHNSTNHTYINGNPIERNSRAEIQYYAEVSFSKSEPFFIAFDEYAEWIRENMCLVSLRSVETHEKMYLFSNEIILGRSFPWASGAMTDRTIGRQHAIISFIDNQCYLTDQSRGGSYINDKKIESHKAILLKNSDRIRFGKEHFIFQHNVLKEGIIV